MEVRDSSVQGVEGETEYYWTFRGTLDAKVSGVAENSNSGPVLLDQC